MPAAPDPAPKQSLREQISTYTDLFKAMFFSPKPPKLQKPAPVKDSPSPQAGGAPAGDAHPFFERHPRAKTFLWQRKFAPAFWTTASVFSLIVNVILIVVLLILARQLFFLKQLVGDKLIGGLYDNFVLMDAATIKAVVPVSDTIIVQDTIPVVFDLPLSQGTSVTLINDTPISQATINLNGVSVPLDIVLPQGTALGINLDLIVPVSQTIPVVLNVPVQLNVNVNIPLKDTELHVPFAGLQTVVGPYRELLAPLPSTTDQACPEMLSGFCNWFFNTTPLR